MHPTPDLLRAHHAFESVDRVPRDPETTAFRRRARLHQALWREANDLPMGTHPIHPRPPKEGRPLGSRIDYRYAIDTGANFLTDAARDAVTERLSNPEPHQTLDRQRLYADLLSSMPMCFNLFAPLAADLELATRAVRAWWPDTPGTVTAVRFEWSPGRALPGRFLENRSAFDVAFELALPDGTRGVIGIETKYHEHCKAEKRPSEGRVSRYTTVADHSGVFHTGATDAILGTPLQQIWLDHLLAMSMIQDDETETSWCRFVLVHPSKNPSFARAACAYQQHLNNADTFDVRTIEALLDAQVLPTAASDAFRARYLW